MDTHPPVVSVQALHAGYANSGAILEDINFEIRAGEIFAIMGPSGSGKSTLFKHLVALQRPLAGSVTLLGQPLGTCSRKDLFNLRKRIGVAFQNGALLSSLNVIDNVELPLHQHTRLDPSTIRIMGRMKLEMMALADSEDLMPSQLSGGMLKRAGLARAVVMDPEILFFDEPSSGLDPATSAEIDELIVKLRDVLNISVVVVTHDLTSALKIADRIMVLADGEIAALGDVNQIEASNNERVQALLHRRAERHRLSGDEYVDSLTHDV